MPKGIFKLQTLQPLIFMDWYYPLALSRLLNNIGIVEYYLLPKNDKIYYYYEVLFKGTFISLNWSLISVSISPRLRDTNSRSPSANAALALSKV